MTAPGELWIDTEPHELFPVYSAGNFGEVAPERLSIVAWSLIGEPVERACRRLARRVLPGETWFTGSTYVFVGYFACRPFHNLSAYCHLATQIPGLTPEDVTSSYFEDAPAPERPDGMRADRLARARALARMVREGTELRGRVVELEGRVVLLEDEARAALARGGELALGRVYEQARVVLEDVWDLHYTTTLALVPLRALQRGLGRRSVPYWSELEPWLNRPAELVWSTLQDARRDDVDLAAGEFLSRAFYEIADEHDPWRRYAERHSAVAHAAEPRAGMTDIRRHAWGMLPRARAALLPQVAHLLGETMASREASKSLAMRCMHVFRRLVPAIARVVGVGDDEWPYLTVGELAEPTPLAELRARAARRREECERALELPVPELVAPGRPDLALAPARSAARDGRAVGRGVSPGLARGVVVSSAALEAAADRPRILVCDSADADIQPILPHVHGLIAARGSVLSHVSILAREYGIPAVVGHPLAGRLTEGQEVSIDGTTGEVQVIGD